MMTRSITAPKIGATMNTTNRKAGSVGQPQPPSAVEACTCQYMYAAIMPKAPWAKLKMPEVVYVTTRPHAAMAYTAATAMPATVKVRNLSMRHRTPSPGGEGSVYRGAAERHPRTHRDHPAG